ncbi:tautomerase family protein [Microlunatus lacustris]
MAQFVIYGHAAALRPRITSLSDAVHEAAVSALQLPETKRFHRFVPLDPECFIAPPDRSQDYTIIEVSMFEGRSTATKKRLISELFRTTSAVGLRTQDVEITITETPRSNWGVRGVPGDELHLTYQVEVQPAVGCRCRRT